MNFFDDENEIIKWFQGVECDTVALIPQDDEVEDIFLSTYEPEEWQQWVNSSGKSDPPPDFYCDKLKLMMDVMRVDDHAHKNKKGKVVNPANAIESVMQKELRESGILDRFPNVENIICNAITDLPTEQDHNYTFYLNNFVRIVEEHMRKIDLYKQNHPNFKTIFFIFDESSAYIEALKKPEIICKGEIYTGRIHYWFWDKSFLNVFFN